MKTWTMSRLLAFVAVVCCGSVCIHAQKLDVKIVDRQSSETGYSYVVPANFSSSSTGNANCNEGFSSVNCSASSRTTGYSSGPRPISYSVTGATLSLLLPDGRVAVVNCGSKYKLKADHINRRSCRTPLVNNIQAEFKGKDAKLMWPVSLDGIKFDSETYKILAVLDK